MAVRLIPLDLTVTHSLSRTALYEGSSFDPNVVSLPPSVLFGIIGGVAGGLCLFIIVHWSLIFCIAVCCMRRRQCHTSSPIDPADSYSPNDGGGVHCNLDTLYSPHFGVSGRVGGRKNAPICLPYWVACMHHFTCKISTTVAELCLRHSLHGACIVALRPTLMCHQ